MTRTWWQRNRAGFPVIIVAVLGLGAFWYFLTWQPVQQGVYDRPERVAAGEVGVMSGSELSNIRTAWGSPQESEELGVPDDARLLAVALDIERTGDAHMSCSFRLSEQGGRERVWMPAISRLTWTFFDTPSDCDTSVKEQKYTALVPFLLPADAEGPFLLEVLGDTKPRYLQLAFTPDDSE